MKGATDVDRRFGALVREARTGLGMTQERVVEAMVHRGFPWYPATVSYAENGKRAIGVAEAAALADVLHLDVSLRDLGAALARGTAR